MTTVADLVLKVRQHSDHENSDFVSDSEIIGYLNEAHLELYDEVVRADEGFFVTTTALTLSGNTAALPTGCKKLVGIDLDSNGRVKTLRRTSIMNRNEYTPGTSSSTPRYYIQGNSIKFIPIPSGGSLTLLYVPNATEFTTTADVFDEPLEQWGRYLVYHAAAQVLAKEESDPSVMMGNKAEAFKRISASIKNRDYNEPQTIVDVYGINRNADWDGVDVL